MVSAVQGVCAPSPKERLALESRDASVLRDSACSITHAGAAVTIANGDACAARSRTALLDEVGVRQASQPRFDDVCRSPMVHVLLISRGRSEASRDGCGDSCHAQVEPRRHTMALTETKKR